MLSKLTDSQLVILSAALARDTGNVLPLPATLTFNKGSAALVLKSLITRGLIVEVQAIHGDKVWREEECGNRFTLRLTQAAVQALGLEVDGNDLTFVPDRMSCDHVRDVRSAVHERAALDPTPGTKQALILDLLRQEQGATLSEIMSATGWRAHSVRGAISGMIRGKLGQTVESLTLEGRGKVYRVAILANPNRPEAGV